MNRISQAICFATEAFDGIFRKGEKCPAIFHSLEAASIAQTVCDDEDVICAVVLHDTVEDAGVKLSEIGERFGERVMRLVSSETEKQYPGRSLEETWQLRKDESINGLRNSTDIGTKVLWLGDKLSNLRSFSRLYNRMGNDMWEMFHQKDPEAHKRYYQAIAKELAVFDDAEAYRELCDLITKMFGE